MHKNVKFSTFNFHFSIFFRTFAADMKKISLIAICLVCALYACAETIVLRTGARMKGEIILQNDEVVILRDNSGARFQYMRADVEEILTVDPQEEEETVVEEDDNIGTVKKASILLELAGGAACIPNDAVGGAAIVNFLVGSHHIGNRHLFIGGGLGYHGLFIGEEKYNFLPVQVALRMPLMEQKHAPTFGVALGYGIALSSDYLGGLYAGLDFGYRCQLNEKTAIAIEAFAQFQQATIHVTEVVEDVHYINKVTRNLVTPGIKFALFF